MEHRVTQLLEEWRSGHPEALDHLMPLVYEQLRSLANRYMRSERPDHTLRATAVVHEAYLRLAGSDVSFENRAHFYAIAARIMRRILLDWAKGHRRDKRGAGAVKIELNEDAAVAAAEDPDSIIEIDLALNALAAFDPRKAELVEMLFFGGLTYDEAAVALQISPATVHRELRIAKAWLFSQMQSERKAGQG